MDLALSAAMLSDCALSVALDLALSGSWTWLSLSHGLGTLCCHGFTFTPQLDYNRVRGPQSHHELGGVPTYTFLQGWIHLQYSLHIFWICAA